MEVFKNGLQAFLFRSTDALTVLHVCHQTECHKCLFHNFDCLVDSFLFSALWKYRCTSALWLTCPGCSPPRPTVEALWVYGVYKVTGLEISKKKKEWVELRSSSKLFVTEGMCKEPIGPTTEDGLFLLFHHIPCESHVYIHFVSIHSYGSVALYCLIWVRFWVRFHKLLIIGCWDCGHWSWQRWCNWVSSVGVCSARAFSSLHTFSFQVVVRAFREQLH